MVRFSLAEIMRDTSRWMMLGFDQYSPVKSAVIVTDLSDWRPAQELHLSHAVKRGIVFG
jgi:hypothetical protein